jgi:hypothetical protein
MSNEQSKLTIQEKSRKIYIYINFHHPFWGKEKILNNFESTNKSIWPSPLHLIQFVFSKCSKNWATKLLIELHIYCSCSSLLH